VFQNVKQFSNKAGGTSGHAVFAHKKLLEKNIFVGYVKRTKRKSHGKLF
jgi:hypothetical protein